MTEKPTQAMREEPPRRCLMDFEAMGDLPDRCRGNDLDEALGVVREGIIRAAKARLEDGPWTVTNKTHMPPDKIDPIGMNLYNRCYHVFDIPEPSVHDYVSLSIYYWPDPERPGGLPYRSKGAVNPESAEYDQGALRATCNTVEALALAWQASGEEKYARRAAELLRHFFLDEATFMAPHMMYAQHIPSDGTPPESFYMPRMVGWRDGVPFYVSYGGMIEGSHLVPLVQDIEMLRSSESWTDEDESGMRNWFEQFLRFMLDTQIGVDESVALNNHASWYYAQAATYADYVGDEAFLDDVLRKQVPARIALQIEPDGSMPAELGRHVAWRYVTFTLTSFFNCAIIAEKNGVDLWNYTTCDGRGLKATLDWMADRIAGEKEIEGKNVEGIQHVFAAPLLALGYEKYGERRYADLLAGLPGFPADHPYRLLFPVEE